MNIFVTNATELKTNVVRDFVVSQLTGVLTRFSQRIARIDVVLTDQNGKRGGIDKSCRVVIKMPGFESFATSAIDENPWTAIATAARRARRKVKVNLKRPRSQRDRFRRRHRQNDFVSDMQSLEKGEYYEPVHADNDGHGYSDIEESGIDVQYSFALSPSSHSW